MDGKGVKRCVMEYIKYHLPDIDHGGSISELFSDIFSQLCCAQVDDIDPDIKGTFGLGVLALPSDVFQQHFQAKILGERLSISRGALSLINRVKGLATSKDARSEELEFTYEDPKIEVIDSDPPVLSLRATVETIKKGRPFVPTKSAAHELLVFNARPCLDLPQMEEQQRVEQLKKEMLSPSPQGTRARMKEVWELLQSIKKAQCSTGLDPISFLDSSEDHQPQFEDIQASPPLFARISPEEEVRGDSMDASETSTSRNCRQAQKGADTRCCSDTSINGPGDMVKCDRWGSVQPLPEVFSALPPSDCHCSSDGSNLPGIEVRPSFQTLSEPGSSVHLDSSVEAFNLSKGMHPLKNNADTVPYHPSRCTFFPPHFCLRSFP
ncbi:hypothetical protein IE53DRAFT_36181 [Violaceomyces palustris]|uniref:Uncharacterized protein n=1 Tax=Violaceomyces palustris TaxID=1673888 RepID=A0ACD0P153_9BASI|nr:hypothetical protein IE53DRAFT_36181 [Violaceomyces palustris]